MRLVAFVISFAFVLMGCAVQQGKMQTSHNSLHSVESQLVAQKETETKVDNALSQPVLKRKIALGRVTNETVYGRSLLRDTQGDVLGKQVSDMLSKALSKSNKYLVFERPDIGRLKEESALTGKSLNLIGVDTIVLGSITEFGRKTEGKKGFLSSTKKQVAYAKIDLRLVDSNTGLVYHTLSGMGESSLESGSVAGFGSQASYDGTLNDKAMAIAVDDAISKITLKISSRTWQTDILTVEDESVYIAAGQSQGVKKGMTFSVQVRGKRIQSKHSGFLINLPGKQVATLKVIDLFGESPINEGAIAIIQEGSITGLNIDDLIVIGDNK